MKPWDQRGDESEPAYAAFYEWVRLSKKRPITDEFAKLLEKRLGRQYSVNMLRKWMTNHDWHARRKSYISWQANLRTEKEAESIARESSLIAKQQTRIRRLAMRKTVSTMTKLVSIDPVDAKECDAILAATLKAMQVAGTGMLDHADQLRRISAPAGQEVVSESPETEEVIPPIPPEPGCVQHAGSEAETVLGQTEGDLPCDR